MAKAARKAPFNASSNRVSPLATPAPSRKAMKPSCTKRSSAPRPSYGPLKARLRTASTAQRNSSSDNGKRHPRTASAYARDTSSLWRLTRASSDGYSSDDKAASFQFSGMSGNPDGNDKIQAASGDFAPRCVSRTKSSANWAHQGSVCQHAASISSFSGHAPPVVTCNTCSAGTLISTSSLSTRPVAAIPRSSAPVASRKVWSSTFGASMPSAPAQSRHPKAGDATPAAATEVAEATSA
mmetsp:Transcript_106747/g.300039  ORF Transcript_106747/g.300039 Transcript_106747/m.300039 type:complete len:239 (-) Transcript_106747:415-1131(-)